MNFFHSIRFRFTLWYLAVLVGLLVCAGAGVYQVLARTLHSNLDTSLHERADQLSQQADIISIMESGTFDGQAGEWVIFYFKENSRLRRVAYRNATLAIEPSMVAASLKEESTPIFLNHVENEPLRVLLQPFTPRTRRQNLGLDRQSSGRDYSDSGTLKARERPGGQKRSLSTRLENIDRAVLIVARSKKDMDLALLRLRQILLAALPLSMIIASLGGGFLAGRVFRPINQIISTAKEIESKDLSRRIPVWGRDELGQLAQTLNQMIDRLQKAFNRQKEFTGDASHELRLPLSTIRAETSLALQKEREVNEYQASLSLIGREAERMTDLVDQLLFLARADAGELETNLITIRLDHMLEVVTEDMSLLCQEKELILWVGPFAEIQIQGDPASIKRMMTNLIQNAITHTPSGGHIDVQLKKGTDMAVISVADTGCGIPEQMQKRIFERFARVDKDRARKTGGSGLGLAICHEIAVRHGGSITVDSSLGQGSIFRVSLPIHT